MGASDCPQPGVPKRVLTMKKCLYEKGLIWIPLRDSRPNMGRMAGANLCIYYMQRQLGFVSGVCSINSARHSMSYEETFQHTRELSCRQISHRLCSHNACRSA